MSRRPLFLYQTLLIARPLFQLSTWTESLARHSSSPAHFFNRPHGQKAWPDTAHRPPTFSIVHMDRKPGQTQLIARPLFQSSTWTESLARHSSSPAHFFNRPHGQKAWPDTAHRPPTFSIVHMDRKPGQTQLIARPLFQLSTWTESLARHSSSPAHFFNCPHGQKAWPDTAHRPPTFSIVHMDRKPGQTQLIARPLFQLSTWTESLARHSSSPAHFFNCPHGQKAWPDTAHRPPTFSIVHMDRKPGQTQLIARPLFQLSTWTESLARHSSSPAHFFNCPHGQKAWPDTAHRPPTFSIVHMDRKPGQTQLIARPLFQLSTWTESLARHSSSPAHFFNCPHGQKAWPDTAHRPPTFSIVHMDRKPGQTQLIARPLFQLSTWTESLARHSSSPAHFFNCPHGQKAWPDTAHRPPTFSIVHMDRKPGQTQLIAHPLFQLSTWTESLARHSSSPAHFFNCPHGQKAWPDTAHRLPTFSIVHMDRKPGQTQLIARPLFQSSTWTESLARHSSSPAHFFNCPHGQKAWPDTAHRPPTFSIVHMDRKPGQTQLIARPLFQLSTWTESLARHSSSPTHFFNCPHGQKAWPDTAHRPPTFSIVHMDRKPGQTQLIARPLFQSSTWTESLARHSSLPAHFFNRSYWQTAWNRLLPCLTPDDFTLSNARRFYCLMPDDFTLSNAR